MKKLIIIGLMVSFSMIAMEEEERPSKKSKTEHNVKNVLPTEPASLKESLILKFAQDLREKKITSKMLEDAGLENNIQAVIIALSAVKNVGELIQFLQNEIQTSFNQIVKLHNLSKSRELNKEEKEQQKIKEDKLHAQISLLNEILQVLPQSVLMFYANIHVNLTPSEEIRWHQDPEFKLHKQFESHLGNTLLGLLKMMDVAEENGFYTIQDNLLLLFKKFVLKTKKIMDGLFGNIFLLTIYDKLTYEEGAERDPYNKKQNIKYGLEYLKLILEANKELLADKEKGFLSIINIITPKDITKMGLTGNFVKDLPNIVSATLIFNDKKLLELILDYIDHHSDKNMLITTAILESFNIFTKAFKLRSSQSKEESIAKIKKILADFIVLHRLLVAHLENKQDAIILDNFVEIINTFIADLESDEVKTFEDQKKLYLKAVEKSRKLIIDNYVKR